MPERKPRSRSKVTPYGRALRLLREALDLTQEEVARALATSPGLISDYECGGKKLGRDRLVEIVEALGLAPAEIDRALAFAEEVRTGVGPASRAGGGEDRLAELEEWGAALARGQIRTFHARLLREATAAVERERAAALWAELQACDAEERLGLVERADKYRSWALADLICAESRRAAARSAGEALALARLACTVAGRLPAEGLGEPFRARVEGYALAHVANAARVGGDLRQADEIFLRARRKWEEGEPGDPEPSLLDEARVLSLEVSLRRDQRNLPEALALAERALARARGPLVADLLIKKANVLELLGRYDTALATLRRAAYSLPENGVPRIRWLQRYGLMVNLCHVGQPREAEALLPEVQGWALERGDELDELRLRWLRGRIAAGLQRWREAAGLFKGVRDAFERLGSRADAALVAVELAAVYLEEGRSPEVKALARQLAPELSALGVSVEAVRALRLFAEAVKREEATAELAHRLVAYLYLVRGNPKLVFASKG